MVDFATPRFVETNGLKMAVYEEGKGLPVIFCHGFPELAYSWRHQIATLAESGFRAIAVDQRGYGASDCPAPAGVENVTITGDYSKLGLYIQGFTRSRCANAHFPH